MKERNENPSNHLSGRLPLHHPDEKVWAGISSSLDQLAQEDAYKARLAGLPLHKADAGTWNLILRRMQWPLALRRTGYAALAAAASILLLFSIFSTSEKDNLPLASGGSLPPKGSVSTLKPVAPNQQLQVIQPEPARSYKAFAQSAEPAITPEFTSGHSSNYPDNSIQPLRMNSMPGLAQIRPHQFRNEAKSRLFRRAEPAVRNVIYAQTSGTIEEKKYYEPTSIEPGKSKGSNFTLAANYLPESLDNGNGTSMFHNVGLTASLGNEKTRLVSSLGMAYNSERRVYDVEYLQTITITVPNPGASHDSTYTLSSMRQSEIEGVERHQYVTYDLGLGKKLFTLGKITTWLNTGAGFAVRLDHSSLEETTLKTFNTTNNAVVKEMDLQIPDYNGVNVNLMAGLDFNYRLMKKLSLSFAPISRVYLRPVLVKDGLPTDSFSLGFRTGMKYDF